MQRGILLTILTGALCLADSPAAELDEYQAKAVFVYNFAKFVEWPPEAFKDGNDSLVICVLGRTPFEQTLDNTVRNKQIDGRGFAVRQVADAKQVTGCHLLFVTGPGLKSFRSLRHELQSLTGLLVVGESEGFVSEGGVINFKLTGRRLRIEINVAEAKREKLVINSRLLGLADVVGK
jgi:hypothetical protein